MNRKTYVALGDSITEGYGVVTGFVTALSEKIASARPDIDLITVNAGMSGDTSRGGLYRLGRDLLELRPDLATVNFGVNDAFSGISPDRFTDNLRAIVAGIRDSGCDRIVMLSCESIPEAWAEQQVLPYWEAMKLLAGELGCVYADVHGKWIEELERGRSENELIIPGDLHPNEAGHELIAEGVFEAMHQNGLIETL